MPIEYINKTDTLNEGREKLNAAIDGANAADVTSKAADTKATQALANSESTQTQLDTIVIDGDSSVEAAQARVDEKGVSHPTLKARIDDGMNSVNQQLAEKANDFEVRKHINVLSYGAIGDGETDDTLAFQMASEDAKNRNLPLYVPNHRFKINGSIPIYTNVYAEGTFVIDAEDEGYAFEIKSKNEPIIFDPLIIEGLTEGSTKINGLPSNIIGATVSIRSHERLIKRNNPSENQYFKRDVFVVQDNNGNISPSLDSTYNDKNEIYTALYWEKEHTKFVWEGGFFEYKGTNNGSRGAMRITRSNVEVNNVDLSINGISVDTMIRLDWCSDIVFNNVSGEGSGISNGTEYGLSIGSACFVYLNNCNFLKYSHGVSGRHGKSVFIDRGSFSTIDSHWGNGYEVKNAIIYDGILFAGKDISVKDSTIHTDHSCVRLRADTPELRGSVALKNLDIYSYNTANSGINLFHLNTIHNDVFDFERELHLPNNYVAENINVYNEQSRLEIIKFGTEGFYQPHKPIKFMKFNNINNEDREIRLYLTEAKTFFSIATGNPIIHVENINNLKARLWEETEEISKFLIDLQINDCIVDFGGESTILGDVVIKGSKVINFHPHEFDLPIGGDVTFLDCFITGGFRIENYFKAYNCEFVDVTGFNNVHLHHKLKIAKGNVINKGSDLTDRLLDYVNEDFYKVTP